MASAEVDSNFKMLEIQMDAVCHANHLTTWTYKQVGTPKLARVVHILETEYNPMFEE